MNQIVSKNQWEDISQTWWKKWSEWETLLRKMKNNIKKCLIIYAKKAKEGKFKIGDLVLVRNSDKNIHGFSQELTGPYVVTDALPGNTYQVHITPT